MPSEGCMDYWWAFHLLHRMLKLKLKHTAEVQMEEHNNKMTEKEAVLPIIFLQVEVKQYLIGRWNAHQS